MNIITTEQTEAAASRASDERLTLAALERLVQQAEPAAILVPPRILRRVIKQDAGVRRLGLRVPHRKTYVISRDDLLHIASIGELDQPRGTQLTATVILIARPAPEHLSSRPAADILLRVWRLLFHAKIHLALDGLVESGRLGEKEVSRRIAALGEGAFSEIRLVLKAEDMLLAPADNVAVYTEFVAVYWELRFLAPALLGAYFPALQHVDDVDAILEQDLNVVPLLEGTQLPGAALPAAPDSLDLVPYEP